jgi:hypothetical protein
MLSFFYDIDKKTKTKIISNNLFVVSKKWVLMTITIDLNAEIKIYQDE